MEWDRRKAEANIEKQGIDFGDAVTLHDDFALTVPDEYPLEDRFITVGKMQVAVSRCCIRVA